MQVGLATIYINIPSAYIRTKIHQILRGVISLESLEGHHSSVVPVDFHVSALRAERKGVLSVFFANEGDSHILGDLIEDWRISDAEDSAEVDADDFCAVGDAGEALDEDGASVGVHVDVERVRHLFFRLALIIRAGLREHAGREYVHGCSVVETRIMRWAHKLVPLLLRLVLVPVHDVLGLR